MESSLPGASFCWPYLGLVYQFMKFLFPLKKETFALQYSVRANEVMQWVWCNVALHLLWLTLTPCNTMTWYFRMVLQRLFINTNKISSWAGLVLVLKQFFYMEHTVNYMKSAGLFLRARSTKLISKLDRYDDWIMILNWMDLDHLKLLGVVLNF